MYSADFWWPAVLAARVPPLVSAMRCRAIRCRLTPLTSTFLTSCFARAGPSGTVVAAAAGVRPSTSVAPAAIATGGRNLFLKSDMVAHLCAICEVRQCVIRRELRAPGYSRRMYAITIREPGDPEVLEWAEVADPRPGPGEVLLDVTASAVNRADLMQREGHYPPPPGASETIGLEVSGHVTALGPGVEGLEVGQPCVALLAGGGYAEQVVAPSGQVIPPPPGYDLVDAAGVLEVAATVWSNLAYAHLTAGETFLVHGGAGG